MTAPTQMRVSKPRDLLTITYADGVSHALSAEMLRVMSPSAEVQGHSPAERVTVPGKKDVTITEIVPTGHYAVRIIFSDGHDTGIFTWSYLEELGREKDERWQTYLEELARQGLAR